MKKLPFLLFFFTQTILNFEISGEDNYADSVVRYTFLTYKDSLLLDKFEYEFDSDGRKISEAYYMRSSGWYGNYKSETIYNPDNRQVLHYGWINKRWSLTSKDFYSLDSAGNVLTDSFYFFSENKWKIFSLTTFSYDLNRREVSRVENEWDLPLLQFIPNSKYESVYDSLGNKELFSYSWDKLKNKWFVTNKNVYTYNNGNLSSVNEFIMSTGSWLKKKKTDYLYDENGHLLLEKSFDWDNSSSSWIDYSKYECEYDKDGNEISHSILYYDSDKEIWDRGSKEVMFYNNKGDVETSLYYYLNESTLTWYLQYRSIHYYPYENYQSILSELSKVSDIQIFPNPATNKINFFNHNVSVLKSQLYDINGKLSKTIEVKPGINTYDISNLKSGLYFLEVLTTRGKITTKFIKK